ncbi:MAG: CRISPR-associated helicase Cas3' [Candidatus Aenigmatarchaeota archaeon]
MQHDQLLARPNQKLIDHLREIKNKIPKNISELEAMVFILHDIGKVSDKFQKKLEKNENFRFRHPLASLPIIEYIIKEYNIANQRSINDDDIDIYLMLVYYHHGQISFDMLQNDLIHFSLQKNDENNINIIEKDELIRVKQILQSLDPNYGKYFDEEKFIHYYLNSNGSDYNRLYNEKLKEILKRIYNKFKMVSPEVKKKFASLYSIFVELDWYSTSDSNKEILPDWNKIESSFKKKFKERKEERVDKDLEVENIRNKIEDLLIKNIDDDRIFICAPTGIGKTELSLEWALNNAKKLNARKIIYVLPYRNLINDLYNRFTFYFGDENVDKWDSNWITDKTIDYVSELSDIEKFNFYLNARKYFMEKPIIITTADQILMSFLNLERYPIRYGMLMNSVIVFDEIQAYGMDMRNLMYKLISEIANIKDINGEYTCKLAITTATPPFEISVSEFKDYIAIDGIPFKLLYDKYWWSFHKKRDANVLISEIDKNSQIVDIIKQKVNESKNEENSRICIIVNTIKNAVGLYRLLEKKNAKDVIKENYEIALIHSSLINEHKQKELDKINKSKKLIAISTQVLEAGVDISFDCIIRLISPIPSLVQSAGRVNRDGKSRNAEFIILLPPNDKAGESGGKEESENSENDKKNKSNINFYGPYDREEINKVIELLRENKGNLIKKSEFSEEFIKKEIDTSKFEYSQSKEYIDFVSNLVAYNIWSVSSLSSILPQGFRDSLGKVEVFVEDESNEKKDIEDKLKNYIKLSKENDYSEYIRKYLQLLREYQGRFILTYLDSKIDTIQIEEYKKNFYPKHENSDK